MKKQILSLALVATMMGAIATGCSSEKKAGGSDSTSTDTSKTATPAATDTAKKDTSAKPDTAKKDTTKKPVH
ncbi:hypothetical protein SAMN05421821_1046 [Mucilaginibacter lappiensis]|uniref:Uncharacterized protein n=1 Tax=Mucilaginibacter lappiensis TaxID=354630 RepID=A0ABR6PIX0_9SPHI|nr:hypothetical protein [Mucilaginibacter lappiensis]MBB6109581.1 hypothetical protein [Mucilaginibacter lappiensis]SIQ89916.1 hypothetical protein SAMN05421821_1046 [Mucilaginibacter lappiensis]